MPVKAETSERKVLPLSNAIIGPKKWRQRTIRLIQRNKSTVHQNNRSVAKHRSMDPLPSLRDTCAESSNMVAIGYIREVRAIVIKLQCCFSDVNDEIKSLLKVKEYMERSMEHIRKDIMLNARSIEIRTERPDREKEWDGADDLLVKERELLLQLKIDLEDQYKEIKEKLQKLAASRQRLYDILRERIRVLELTNIASASVNNDYSMELHPASWRGLVKRTTSQRSLTSRSQYDGNILSDSAQNRQTSREGDISRQQQLMRTGCYLGRTMKGEERPTTPPIDPLGPLTPECDHAIKEGRQLIGESEKLKALCKKLMKDTEEQQRDAHVKVNDGVTCKLAETVTLMQHLQINEGENRAAFNKTLRYYDETDRARGINIGPEASGDLETRERLDRPLIKVFQRHPATSMPEAGDLIKTDDALHFALNHANRNLANLHKENLFMRDDERDKRKAASVDSSIIRLRRRRANHRWIYGEV